MERFYLVDGAKLQCTLGTSPGKLTVISQQKLDIQGKLQATGKDKLLEPPFFGSCTCKSPNPPCSPALQDWQMPGKKTGMDNEDFILDDSQIQCSQGGMITVLDANQDSVSTGEEDKEIETALPKLEGEIIFVNGFHSDVFENAEHTLQNSILDIDPDNTDHKHYKQGESVNERNRADENDIFTNEDLEKELPDNERTEEDIEKAINRKKLSTRFSFNNGVGKFWGYWNQKANQYEGADMYARFFNAYRNDHYINGSHGLGSNAAHRIDHGIALGYLWAKGNWGIWAADSSIFNDGAEAFKRFTPVYRPITIVAHSHGSAVGAGVSIGIMYYALEMKWDSIPLNIIFLGTHQPQNLTGRQYHEFLERKVDYYEVDKTFPNIGCEKEAHSLKFLNGLAEIFDTKRNKVKHERGIYEHLKEILNGWEAYTERCVQFTFANDRGDLVTRDGDIPDIQSACNPKVDESLFCAEYMTPDNLESSDKKIISTAQGGYLVLSTHIANRRFEFNHLKKDADEKLKKEGEEWGNFESVALYWADAFEEYKIQKAKFESLFGETYQYTNIVADRYRRISQWFDEKNPFADDRTEREEEYKKAYNKVTDAYENMLLKYASLQQACLYAHFAPVSLINHGKLISDIPDDGLGTESIAQRIAEAGKDKFYRVEYDSNPREVEKMSSKDKRRKETDYVNRNSEKLIITSIVDTDYIKNVIKAYIEGNEKIETENLYHEPNKTRR